ncbi:MAG: succinyl-diaminopimelate desuccinylase [Rhodospirillaceae bacterium]|nr:succinyl-diaminopimelate desuccinylase [Rhodospirillaceae bacterium]
MTGTDLTDALELSRALIRRPSVTPRDEGALDVLQAVLTKLGFVCHRLTFADEGAAPIENLYARLGSGAPNFCFAGHTDVVPVGNGWTTEPFKADVIDGYLYGRGASDMKCAIAAFTSAAAQFIGQGAFKGSISLLITGDEEGDAINGTKKVLDWMTARGERIDVCVVGEPTSQTKLGDMAKIGRRGSLTAKLTVYGTQGHSAYPHLADNPIPRLMTMLGALIEKPLDNGTAHFQASTLAITTFDVGNAASNVIPGSAKAAFNVRYNDLHTGEKLKAWLKKTLDAAANGGHYDLDVRISGESFITPPGPLSELIAAAVKDVTGRTPELSTTGGTSDARFIKDMCPVAEFGLVGLTMHKADERCALTDLEALTAIYKRMLQRYFAAP